MNMMAMTMAATSKISLKPENMMVASYHNNRVKAMGLTFVFRYKACYKGKPVNSAKDL